MEARLEMGKIVADQRITRALRSKFPPAVTHHIKPGDDDLDFRKKREDESATTNAIEWKKKERL